MAPDSSRSSRRHGRVRAGFSVPNSPTASTLPHPCFGPVSSILAVPNHAYSGRKPTTWARQRILPDEGPQRPPGGEGRAEHDAAATRQHPCTVNERGDGARGRAPREMEHRQISHQGRHDA